MLFLAEPPSLVDVHCSSQRTHGGDRSRGEALGLSVTARDGHQALLETPGDSCVDQHRSVEMIETLVVVEAVVVEVVVV